MGLEYLGGGDGGVFSTPRPKGSYRMGSDGSKHYDSGVVQNQNGSAYGNRNGLDPVNQTVLKQEAEKRLEEQLLVEELKRAMLEKAELAKQGAPRSAASRSTRTTDADAALQLLNETPEQINRRNVPAAESGIVIEDADTGIDMVEEGLAYSRPGQTPSRMEPSRNPERGGMVGFSDRPSTVARGEANPEFEQRKQQLMETLMGGGEKEQAARPPSGSMVNAQKSILDTIRQQKVKQAQLAAAQRMMQGGQVEAESIADLLNPGQPDAPNPLYQQLMNDPDLMQVMGSIDKDYTRQLEGQLTGGQPQQPGIEGGDGEQALSAEEAVAYLVSRGKSPEEARRIIMAGGQ